MKLILSRKGFDRSYDGCASPIFEDDSFVSLPIPEPSARLSFSDIGNNRGIAALVEDLTRKHKEPLKSSSHVHLDPDLRSEARAREPGWRPLFGQADAAQRHL